MNRRRRHKAKRRRLLIRPKYRAAFKAARYMAMHGASSNTIVRTLDKHHPVGLSRREIHRHLELMRLYL